MSLNTFSIVACTALAQACQRCGLPVLADSDPRSKALKKLRGPGSLQAPGALLQRHLGLLRSHRDQEDLQQLLLAALSAASSDAEVQQVMQCPLLPEGKATRDLWRPTDPIAKMLGAVELESFAREVAKLPMAKRQLKSTLGALHLLELLQNRRPQDRLPQEARDKFLGVLLDTLEKMESRELQQLQGGLSSLPVFFVKGQWRQSSEIFLHSFWSVLSCCEAAVLPRRCQADVERLFAERPPVRLVAKHLRKLAEGKQRVRPESRRQFLVAYEYLERHLGDEINDVTRELSDFRCILDKEGVLRLAKHFSLRLLIDLGPIHVVAEDVKPFPQLLQALGASQTVSGRPLPEALKPDKLLEVLKRDESFTDLIVECNDGQVAGHRAIWCQAGTKILDKLAKSSDGSWRLREKAKCTKETLQVVKDMIYSGRVDNDRIDKLTPERQQECLKVTRWFGMAYAQEWLKQYLHGAAPEEPEPAGASQISTPAHWQQGPMPEKGWRAVRVSQSDPIFRKLCDVLKPESASHLGHGRDCHGWPRYTRLELRRAWRIWNMGLWQKQAVERSQLKDLPKGRLSAMPRVTVRPALVQCTDGLPNPVCKDLNEAFLLHGTKPESVKLILSSGLNERFSGGLFGHGSYLAEDPAKSDQYATVDQAGTAVPKDLYDGDHPGNVFYIFVCRTLLGWFVQTKDGERSLGSSAQSIWATSGKRELSLIPGTETTFHSLQVEVGDRVLRHREYILTHSERIYPEYLLAYSRL